MLDYQQVRQIMETKYECPKCGNKEYETVKHSWRDGVTPYDTYYVCWSCDHEWIEDEFNQTESHQHGQISDN